MRLAIGLVGKKGSGKGTFVSLLKELLPTRSIETFRFSDVLYETLDIWSVPTTRENLQKLAVIMEEMEHGALSHAVRSRAKRSNADIVVFDGIRWDSDLAVLRSFHKNLLVYIGTNAQIRFERMKARNEKVGEGDMTWDQFIHEENALNEVGIDKIAKSADVTLLNNKDVASLKKRMEDFIHAYKTVL